MKTHTNQVDRVSGLEDIAYKATVQRDENVSAASRAGQRAIYATE